MLLTSLKCITPIQTSKNHEFDSAVQDQSAIIEFQPGLTFKWCTIFGDIRFIKYLKLLRNIHNNTRTSRKKPGKLLSPDFFCQQH